MKFYIYTNKQTDDELLLVEKVVLKLFPDAQIEKGKSKPGKYKEEKLLAEKAHVLKAEDYYSKNKREVANKLLELLGVGVSEKVLSRL